MHLYFQLKKNSEHRFQHPFDPPIDSDTSEGIDVDAVPTPPSNKFYSHINPPLKFALKKLFDGYICF